MPKQSRHHILAAIAVTTLLSTAAQADCTLIADASTKQIAKQEGTCDARITPASTFKIAISLMGFDSGFLKSEHQPVLKYRSGDPDWRDSWRADTDPQKWIRDSVVWYSQRVTAALGAQRFQQYATAFRIGNADVSGDPKKHDGLKWAWIDSSLQVSPREELGFLERVVRRELPVRTIAYEMTARITAMAGEHGGWEIHGKTGAGFPVLADGRSDHAHGYGWFVGWATKGDRTFVFVRQIQDTEAHDSPAGVRARDAFLPGLPALLDEF
ncbi:class D beta-lactamase [Scleromatobacter humisilvae]|uniref:Beta-lactamase n=1 Tax=Scleromatobacter humisilvae TaxID=2897159 RepID=A0A9X1YGA2_9BURK|nr:class D beta-lactamase [Scleromatobacter humisilvae]MCK9685974.1 class D beta-lactamase [Scleromatobacter humisilvae]